MAQLKDTVITGDLRVTDEIYGKHKGDTFYVKGTQTGSTGSWTGNLPEVDALYEGLAIDYWLPFAGSGNATLNLTLKDGTTTGAINCYFTSNTRLTTHMPQYSIIRMIYQTVTISGTSYTGWWPVKGYDSNDNAVYMFRLGSFIADSAVYRYQFLFGIDNDRLTPLNNVDNNTGTSKTLLTNVEFDPLGFIIFLNAAPSISANGTINGWGWLREAGICDMRYTFNCGSTLTLNKSIYLKTVLQSSGKVKLATGDPLAYVLPSTNDGYLYIYLGKTYSNYQIDLDHKHPVYYHDGTSLRQFVKQDLATTSFPGLMSSSDKSKLNGYSTMSIGSASTGTAIDADDITAWSAGTTPTLGTAIDADDITAWSAGTLPSAIYDSETETLELTFGSLPSLSYTAKSIPNVTSVGTTPSLSYTAKSIPNISVTSKTVVTSS